MFVLASFSTVTGIELKLFLFGLLLAVEKVKNATKQIFRCRKSKYPI